MPTGTMKLGTFSQFQHLKNFIVAIYNSLIENRLHLSCPSENLHPACTRRAPFTIIIARAAANLCFCIFWVRSREMQSLLTPLCRNCAAGDDFTCDAGGNTCKLNKMFHLSKSALSDSNLCCELLERCQKSTRTHSPYGSLDQNAAAGSVLRVSSNCLYDEKSHESHSLM